MVCSMKKVRGSREVNLASMRNYYNMMKHSFEAAFRGDSRSLNKTEIDACYEWRIANIIIKDTLEPDSCFSYDEWASFANSCGGGVGMSASDIKRAGSGIMKLYADMMTASSDMWRSTEERRRYNEAVERLNRFLSVEMYSEEAVHVPSRKIVESTSY